jgi:hypothetical protein
MVFSKTTETLDGMEPTPEMLEAFAAMDRYMEELVEAGVFIAAAGLKPETESKRISIENGNRTITDGPFAEAREIVAGFSIWEVKDMDEAVAWAMRAPIVSAAPGAMEIRPFYEVADLGAFITEEDRANPRTGERAKLGVA